MDLNPSGLLYVCPGESLRVECNTSGEVLRWEITISSIRNLSRTLTFQRGNNDTLQPTKIFYEIFPNLTISKISSSPLFYAISTDYTTADLHETRIVCLGIGPGINPQISAPASVQLIVAGTNGVNANCKFIK